MSKFLRFMMATATAVFAAATISSPAQASPNNQIKVLMLNTGVDLDARGRLIFVENKAQSHFMIKCSGLDPSLAYDIVLDGNAVESLVVDANGEARSRHRGRKKGPGQGPLAYDPRGLTLEIATGGLVVLSSNVPASAQQAQERIEIEINLTPEIGVLGSAEAEFESRFGRMKFEVEMEDFAQGTYDLFVGGIDVGDIVVGAAGEGEIEFDSKPESDNDGSDDGLDLLLTFDPLGQAIEIRTQDIAPVLLFTGFLSL